MEGTENFMKEKHTNYEKPEKPYQVLVVPKLTLVGAQEPKGS